MVLYITQKTKMLVYRVTPFLLKCLFFFAIVIYFFPEEIKTCFDSNLDFSSEHNFKSWLLLLQKHQKYNRYIVLFINITYTVLGLIVYLCFLIKQIPLNLFIVSILLIIFILAFSGDFYNKHFKFSWANTHNFLHHCFLSLKKNPFKVIKYLVNLVFIGIIVRIIIRYPLFWLFTYHDLLTTMFIVIISIPLISYSRNILLKYISKDWKLTSKDFYLLNDSVIQNTNLYAISRLSFITYIIREYPDHYLFAITLLIISLLISLCIAKIIFPETISIVSKKSNLRSQLVWSGDELRIVGLGSLLCAQNDEMLPSAQEIEKQDLNSENKKQILSVYNNSSSCYRWGIRTVHYYNTGNNSEYNNSNDRSLNYQVSQPQQQSTRNMHWSRIAGSPILSLVYKQGIIARAQGLSSPEHKCMFVSDHCVGSVSTIESNKTLIIGFFKPKSIVDSKLLAATFALQRDIYLVQNALQDLKNQYGIEPPMENPQNLIILTQIQFSKNTACPNIVEVWKPTLHYRDYGVKDYTKVQDYFYLDQKNTTGSFNSEVANNLRLIKQEVIKLDTNNEGRINYINELAKKTRYYYRANDDVEKKVEELVKMAEHTRGNLEWNLYSHIHNTPQYFYQLNIDSPILTNDLSKDSFIPNHYRNSCINRHSLIEALNNYKHELGWFKPYGLGPHFFMVSNRFETEWFIVRKHGTHYREYNALYDIHNFTELQNIPLLKGSLHMLDPRDEKSHFDMMNAYLVNVHIPFVSYPANAPEPEHHMYDRWKELTKNAPFIRNKKLGYKPYWKQ